jgi:hypothetical protein
MNPTPFFQTPFGIFTAGLILQFVFSAFLLGRIYERFKKCEQTDLELASDIGKLSVRTNNLRDAQVALAYFLDTKHTNPHPDPRIRKVIEILVNWEQDRTAIAPSPIVGD